MSVVYATDDEVKAADAAASKTLMSLDVFQHPSFPRNCPVVIYIHGGQWKQGSKEERPPVLSYLALKRYVVVAINHRLAPQVTVSEQLIDVKRAIRWVKANISKFGGDPGFVSIMGSCSGAHLATMATMTANEAEYQPGFEDVDTSIQACITLAGFYDVTHSWGYKFSYKFDKKVVQEQNSSTARIFSPTWRLKEAEANKARIAATEDEKKGPLLPNFLMIQ
ncbi:hypothetical protein HDU91_003735 [Kappamyces sp. JEL0680]|nr:hypothetical protein HDU91_003735 [Kappamyces sp. JEL0680]